MGGLFGRRGGNKAAPKTKPNLAIPEPTQSDDNNTGMKANQYSQVGKSGNFRKKGNSNSGGRTVATPNSPKMSSIDRKF
mgnify:FL=1